MRNFVGRLIGGEHEEPTPSDACVVRTPDGTPGLHATASEDCAPSVNEVAHGDCGQARSWGEQKAEHPLVCAEAMMQSRRECSLDVDQEIERSKSHWSELKDVEDSDEDMDEAGVIRENFQVFSELKDDPRCMNLELGQFFKGPTHSSILGRKIAEGGQAEIFELVDNIGDNLYGLLVKLFKKGSRLSQLRQKWSFPVLQWKVPHVVLGGLLLEDGRFEFTMFKCWVDLHTLIVHAMQAKSNQGPPVPFEWNGVTFHPLHIMMRIAMHMVLLHRASIVHRDMKASNILLCKDRNYPHVVVVDYECSIGVVGTGFWRVPKILLGLKNKTTIDYFEKVDVYGYSMTYYEIVTGMLPFGDELDIASNDQIIGGQRPKLPSDLDVALKGLIERCGDPNPLERPSFLEILKVFKKMLHCLCNEETVNSNVVACNKLVG